MELKLARGVEDFWCKNVKTLPNPRAGTGCINSGFGLARIIDIKLEPAWGN